MSLTLIETILICILAAVLIAICIAIYTVYKKKFCCDNARQEGKKGAAAMFDNLRKEKEVTGGMDQKYYDILRKNYKNIINNRNKEEKINDIKAIDKLFKTNYEKYKNDSRRSQITPDEFDKQIMQVSVSQYMKTKKNQLVLLPSIPSASDAALTPAKPTGEAPTLTGRSNLGVPSYKIDDIKEAENLKNAVYKKLIMNNDGITDAEFEKLTDDDKEKKINTMKEVLEAQVKRLTLPKEGEKIINKGFPVTQYKVIKYSDTDKNDKLLLRKSTLNTINRTGNKASYKLSYYTTPEIKVQYEITDFNDIYTDNGLPTEDTLILLNTTETVSPIDLYYFTETLNSTCGLLFNLEQFSYYLFREIKSIPFIDYIKTKDVIEQPTKILDSLKPEIIKLIQCVKNFNKNNILNKHLIVNLDDIMYCKYKNQFVIKYTSIKPDKIKSNDNNYTNLLNSIVMECYGVSELNNSLKKLKAVPFNEGIETYGNVEKKVHAAIANQPKLFIPTIPTKPPPSVARPNVFSKRKGLGDLLTIDI